jgi:tRNA-specific 2-thiouridylase
MFVVGIRPADLAVIIGPREELLGRGLVVREVNALKSGELSAESSQLLVQVRHRARPVPATIIRNSGDELELALDEPIAAITPGQSAVFYDGERVLGGGIIEAALGQRMSLPVMAA